MVDDSESPRSAPDDPTLARHIAAARRRVAHLEGLAAGCDAAERKILEAAEARAEALDEELSRARRRAGLDPRAARRVEELTAERARCHVAAATARMRAADPT